SATAPPPAATPTRTPTAAAPAVPPPATPARRPSATRSVARPPAARRRPAAPGSPLHASGAWRRAFADHAGGIGCEQGYAQLAASGTARLTVGRTTLFVGFQQYGRNQDPVVARFDGTTKVYCEHHEKQSPDGRALGLTWDGGATAYVVYTVVGGGTDLETAARGGWVDHYGDGGGSSSVTVLGRVDVRTGTLTRATFVPAHRGQDGRDRTNSLVPAAAPLVTASGGVALPARSAYSPLNPDRSRMCHGASEYPSPGPGRIDEASWVGVFAADLASLTCATTWGCGAVRRPCPAVG
ncbi:MAG TPA: hypothetical protein VE781_15180, partial [Kineosporiaceae bacterium]|nr:hypothetical protein [Kineosporiaceae bacterium]